MEDDIRLIADELNSQVMEETLAYASFNQRPSVDPAVMITEDILEIAEETTAKEVLSCIHPTLDSDEKRKDVIEYVQSLIKTRVGLEVSPYGSVPLKTYLPDGDIDLTVLSIPVSEDPLPREVLGVMHAEQLNENAEYEVRDTQFIDAEVKLVKCLVQDIVIDISFNQLGGLSTLCFLEQVDRLVGKDHLFKRSIILIKAWCYYESRILGAHHGLISTYALETLILYIFHLFNSSLSGPLAVLYRFLDYFSNFDWENYCISLNGPVRKSSLPEIVVENLENGGEELLLSEEFLRNCVDMFSVSSRSLETNLRVFPVKYLNIIDPLKENNNLGRSVHRGNFYRIRSAFKYGARRLGEILMLPQENIGKEIKDFFDSTLERHGHKDVAQVLGRELGSLSSSIISNDDALASINGTIDEDFPGVEYNISSGLKDESDRYLETAASSQMVLACSPEGTVVSGDANDATPVRSLYLRNTNVASDCSPLERDSNDSPLASHNTSGLCVYNCDSGFSDSVISSLDDSVLDNLSIEFREKALDSIAGDIETLNLSDLTGDYDNHVRSLLYGQSCHGYALSLPALRSPPSSSFCKFQNEPSDTVLRNMQLKRLTKTNGAALGKPLVPAKNPAPSIHAFGLEEREKVRGTGTYIPIMDSSREKPRQQRRYQVQEIRGQPQKHRRSNMTNSSEEGGHELRRAQSPMLGNGEPFSYYQPFQVMSDNCQGNGFPNSNRVIEFGSFGPIPQGSIQLTVGNYDARGCTSSLKTVEEHNSKQAKGKKQQGIEEKSLNLENEDDFPPLSS